MTSALLIDQIERAELNLDVILHRVRTALAEDSHDGDITSKATIPLEHQSQARFTARKPGVVAGVLIAALVLEECGVNNYQIRKTDGEQLSAGDVILSCEGATQSILTAERTALNFLSHLSGIATLTQSWCAAIAGTGAKIRDTRKTIPGMRELEKYAVRMGGGVNHRMSLADSALIKDNHIAAVGSIATAVERVRAEFPGSAIEVEADNLEQVKEALACKVEMILLDNMSLDQTKQAVEMVRGSATKLESSGGLILENAAAYAATGVHFLAVGALTHSAPALDIGLDF